MIAILMKKLSLYMMKKKKLNFEISNIQQAIYMCVYKLLIIIIQ